MEDLDPPSPGSIRSSEMHLYHDQLNVKCKKNVQVEETSEKEFREVATKYMQKLTCGPVEKEKTADYHFCDMIAKSLNAMIDGEQKELLKLEIHQLVVKAQYGTSASRSLGNHLQLTFKSGHRSPTYQRSNIEQTVSFPNFNSNEYQTFSHYSNMGY